MIPKALIEALRWMTILPMPQQRDTIAPAAMLPWLPVTGMVVGAALWAGVALGGGYDSWLAALLGTLIWFVLTGFLHADGLADLTDAWMAAHAAPPEQRQARFLTVLKDPHIGSFGVMVLILLVLNKVILVYLVVQHGHAAWLFWIPIWARVGVLFWLKLPPLTQGSAAAMQQTPQHHGMAWVLGLLLMALLGGSMLWLAPLFLWLWFQYLKRYIHGVNGDALGAGIECCEVCCLLLLL